MTKENSMEMKCPCGGKLLECTLNTGIASVQSVTVPNGYNFPKQYQVKAYICSFQCKCALLNYIIPYLKKFEKGVNQIFYYHNL